MPKPKILLADNVASFSNTCAEYLELFGYQVQKVFTPEDCLQVLEEGLVHLAVLDLRLRDDTDEKDISGLTLAKRSNPLIPKIILTSFPSWEIVREARRRGRHESPPAVSFVSKLEGLEVLLEYIRDAFEQHVRINWDLEIDWRERDRFSLVRLIEPGLDDERLPQRADQVEDLFRRLFRPMDQIKIGELLWRRQGRLALKVFAFAKDRMPESSLVVCGHNEELKDEANRFRDHAPKSHKANSATLYSTAETIHFAANAYALGECDLENARPLHELYRTDTKAFTSTINTLYEQTLAEWSQEKRKLEESRTLDELYRSRLNLAPPQIDQPALAAKIRTLVPQLSTIGLRTEMRDDELTLHFNGESFSYFDPTPFVYQTTAIGQPVLLVNTPGALSGDNILIGRNDQVWLTDFAEAGLAPLLWNYVTLEAAIRFDWMETNHPRRLHELEECLIENDFTRFEPRDFEAPLQKPLRAIQQIRLIAQRKEAQDWVPYHLGIFLHAAGRLAQAALKPNMNDRELSRLGHLLLSMAMIARFVLQEQSLLTRLPGSGEFGIRLDEKNYEAWVDGLRVRLTEQEFNLLSFLHSRANQLCALREIVEQVLGYKYDEGQEANVHTAINRLRKKIQPYPQSRRYIRNERGRGYRLILDPPTSSKR